MSFDRAVNVKKTRKTKLCAWCHEFILKGEPSVYTAGVYDSDFYSARYHPECHAAVHRYYKAHNCWGEEMPDWVMNRGGIEEQGEKEPDGFCAICHKPSTTLSQRCWGPNGHVFKPLETIQPDEHTQSTDH